MENINPIIPNPVNNNPAPAPVHSKRRIAIIVSLSVIMVIVGCLATVNYFSNWKCADGEWIRDGFPLSGKPKGKCEKIKEIKPTANTENNSTEEKQDDLSVSNFEEKGIIITSPKNGETIKSPLIVEGKVRGIWFFEGEFPIKILDANGSVIAYGSARHTSNEWMTTDYVPFQGEIKFSSPDASQGLVLFSEDDPSGMAKNIYSVSIPVKFEKSSGEASGAKFFESKCGHDPMNDPILGDCGEDCNTENWKVFTNKKYGYSFRYPANYALSNNCKNDSCVSVEENGDSVYISGEHIVGDWPIIYVRHLQNEHYNPPAHTEIMNWIKQKFSWTEKCFPDTENIYLPLKNGEMLSGWNIFFPQSPQAHSRREIFYERSGKIFQIEMIDVDSPQARQFYNIWLSTFRVLGEN